MHWAAAWPLTVTLSPMLRSRALRPSAGRGRAALSGAASACLPCALSFGESHGIDGRTLLVAYAAGMETAIRVGAAAKGGFHHVGFHATGLVAHFSSAVVAARILGLPV